MKALPVLVLVLLATLGFIGYRMSTRPVLVVRNELAFPVRVALLGHDTLLPAGSVLERVVSREQPVAVRWEMKPWRVRCTVDGGTGVP